MAKLDQLEHTMSAVRFPQMRSAVLSSLQALADEDYQRRVWVDRIYPHAHYFDDLTLNINILYDDTQVLSVPFETVGSVLSSNAEAEAMERLAGAINLMFDRLGTDRPDHEYLDSPEWRDVVSLAHAALVLLEGGETKSQ